MFICRWPKGCRGSRYTAINTKSALSAVVLSDMLGDPTHCDYMELDMDSIFEVRNGIPYINAEKVHEREFIQVDIFLEGYE